MKNRLQGLLALMLCLSLILTPFGSALADNHYHVENVDFPYEDIEAGDLISSGVWLSQANAAGYDPIHFYENGLEDGNPTKTLLPSAASSGYDVYKHEVSDVAATGDFEADLWAAATGTYSRYLSLERVYKRVDIGNAADLGDGRELVVFSDLQTYDSGYDSIDERRGMLTDAAKAWNADSKTVFYQMGVYKPVEYSLVENSGVFIRGVMRYDRGYNAEAQKSVTLTLPYPDGVTYKNSAAAEFKLFHIGINYEAISSDDAYFIESFDVTPTKNGLQVTLKNFSPYALAYTAPEETGDDDDDDDNNDGDDDNNGGAANDGNGGAGTAEDGAAASLPKTGDNSSFAMWLALAFVGIVGLTGLRRRKDA